ncbi:TatD family nuclease-associated radical SAM protein [Desulfuromonas sp. KJ2020]|uniref:TatD family hydrolase n=1 Tax=Desulfuromonas sp. KJ2020 TaxID=2919173 RepID=UPI0020A73734|nr:TatD family hydrolase [Desulfuromonas sp. KJ2020]MCP3177631.1 TatD family nuclease-associated radical SAM protein [Desulfuromonas sp. KJ2020]
MTEQQPWLIDTHAHLDNGQFDHDREEVISRARQEGIRYILTVGCDLDSSLQNLQIAEKHPFIYAAVGIHPHDAAQLDEKALAQLRTWVLEKNRVVAVGEIGLDFYRDRCPRDIQRLAFRQQIRLARELKKPIIVHDRDAHAEVLQILREEQATEVGGVVHCFSGDLAMARACIDLGFLISFPGSITYPKNEEVRDLIRLIPVDHFLVETDCPYLAPQPRRGKRNEPALVRHTAATIAEIKGLSLEDVCRVTNLNAFRLFGIGESDAASRIAYRIRDALYLNITNRCTNRCAFCAKFRDFTVKGHGLQLDHEPSAEEIIAAIGDPAGYSEIVFCGYGEPLIRLETVKEVAAWLKARGAKVRINTDGQANLVYGRNILPELKGLVDAISVSLNAADAETYQRICHSQFGLPAYEGVKAFLHEALAHIPSVTASAVAMPGIDMEACADVARDLGVEFRARPYNDLG